MIQLYIGNYMSRKCVCRDSDDWCLNQSCECREDDPNCPDCTNVDFCGNLIE